MSTPTPSPPTPARSPWQRLYAAALVLRRRWYRRRAAVLPRPVVSVGNLHWGGAGKTPLVAALAARLRDRERRVAILSRGYGRRSSAIQVVADWRQGPLVGPAQAGDEPMLLAGQLPGVAVVVGADRAAAGRAALARLDPPPDLFLLDDGFSHLRLARDLDLLAFPAADPWGGGRLPPSGRLREPLAAAARADAVLLTGSGVESADGAALAAGLAAASGAPFDPPAFAAPTRAEAPRLAGGRRLETGARVFLVSAIAHPGALASSAAELGLEVAGEVTFKDHYDYPDASLERILAAFRASGADAVLTTAKDGVKLHGRLQAPLAELPVRADPEAAFWVWLDERLAAIGGRRG